MTTPFWCLLIAAFLPFVLAGIGGYFKSQQFDTLDNNNPRVQSAQLVGAGARAVAAQQNAWEALAIFTAAVAVAHMAGADPGTSAMAAMLFIVSRKHRHTLTSKQCSATCMAASGRANARADVAITINCSRLSENCLNSAARRCTLNAACWIMIADPAFTRNCALRV